MSIKTVVDAIGAGIKTHKPEIMIGIGLAAGAGAIAVAIKETPACLDAFDQAKEEAKKTIELPVSKDEVEVECSLDWKTKARILGRYYWGVVVLEAASIFFVIYGSKIRFDLYTGAIALYGVAKAERDDLRKIISEQPKNWQKNFNEKRAESHLAESDPKDIPPARMSNTEVPMALPLLWDDQAKVYFRMSDDELRDAVAELTHRIGTDPFQQTNMNDWMDIIGHEPVAGGEYQILTYENEGADGALKYNQIGVKEAPNGEPCRMMRFSWEYHADLRGMSIGAYGDI